jgi:hypothetical protein
MMKVTLAVVALAALTAAASGVLRRRVALLRCGSACLSVPVDRPWSQTVCYPLFENIWLSRWS